MPQRSHILYKISNNERIKKILISFTGNIMPFTVILKMTLKMIAVVDNARAGRNEWQTKQCLHYFLKQKKSSHKPRYDYLCSRSYLALIKYEDICFHGQPLYAFTYYIFRLPFLWRSHLKETFVLSDYVDLCFCLHLS